MVGRKFKRVWLSETSVATLAKPNLAREVLEQVYATPFSFFSATNARPEIHTIL